MNHKVSRDMVALRQLNKFIILSSYLNFKAEPIWIYLVLKQNIKMMIFEK